MGIPVACPCGKSLAGISVLLAAGAVWWCSGPERTGTFRKSPPEPRPASAAEESHLLDENHPDYGGIVWLALVENAGRKVRPGEGLGRWFDSLHRNEREAVAMNQLCGAASAGDIRRFVRRGYGDELRPLLRTLRNEVDTPTSRAAADALERLVPFVRPGVTPDNQSAGPGGGVPVWQGPREERESLLDELDPQLEPLVERLRKDVDHYFYRRWKVEGGAIYR